MNEIPSTLAEMSKSLVLQLNSFCEEHGLVGLVQADHICIRCSSNDIYEKRRRDMEKESRFVYQSMIAGRRISVIGLADHLVTSIGDIRYLELADQKPDNSQIDRIDHIEIVPTTVSYTEVVARLTKDGVEMKETVRPHHTTHDITLPSGFSIRLSSEPLVEKIKREEMK